VVREVVVVRGPDAMAPRELLPLHLPEEVTGSASSEASPDAGAAGGRDRADLDPFSRGPEITEVR
jgi:hypothetical protein